MPTTIQVSDTTKQLLDKLKQERHAKTYDQVIQELLPKQKSMFGRYPAMRWKKEDRMDF